MSEPGILFRARRRREPVAVTLATDADLAAVAGVDSASDMVEFWRFIAVRSSSGVAIHAVGWRLLRATVWITSALVAVDRTLGAIETMAGNQYSLGVPGRSLLEPELANAITAALRRRGFTHLRPVPAPAPRPKLRRKRSSGAAKK